MNRIKEILLLLLAVCLFTACSSDDDEVYGEGLTGKWDLVELQNGPEGSCKGDYVRWFASGTVTIELKEKWHDHFQL